MTTYGERVDAGEPMSEVWLAMMEFHKASGALPIRDTVWVGYVDERWKVYVNGWRVEAEVDGITIPVMHMAITYNGWPAGLCDMFGGVIAAGVAANEDSLIAALRAATARAEGPADVDKLPPDKPEVRDD